MPGASGSKGAVDNTMPGSGCVVAGGTVTDSILSACVQVEEGAHIESSILFDNVSVGSGAKLRRCIVEKSVQLPANARIGFDTADDESRYAISDNGVVVVDRGKYISITTKA